MNENSMNYIVREYIKEVEKRLPEYLKDKKEHKEILADLEEHLWSKAAELSETGQPNEKSVKQAIEHMGTPQSIAKEYKRRGEPKYYIASRSKEAFEEFPKIGIICIYFAPDEINQEIKSIANKTITTTKELEMLNGV